MIKFGAIKNLVCEGTGYINQPTTEFEDVKDNCLWIWHYEYEDFSKHDKLGMT